LGAGSDGNLQDKNGYTPLHHAVKRGVNIPAGMAGKISPSVLWDKFISFVADGEAFQRGVMQLFRASAETRNQNLLPARRLSEYCVPENGKVPNRLVVFIVEMTSPFQVRERHSRTHKKPFRDDQSDSSALEYLHMDLEFRRTVLALLHPVHREQGYSSLLMCSTLQSSIAVSLSSLD
jgi:hypothetical protein